MMFGKDSVWGGGGGQSTVPRAISSSMMMGGGSIGASPTTPGNGEKQLCKYFVNGGCLRGDQCSYLHELPDERHLDVNGLGFIFKSNVHNAQKTVVSSPGPSLPGVAPNGMGILGGSVVGGGVPPGVVNAASVGVPPNINGLLVGASISANTLMPSGRKQGKRVIPRYRPPEPVLDHNLPPALAIPFAASQTEVVQNLMATLGGSSELPHNIIGGILRV
ncbi:Hypothetical protein, putative [Bodo saltans]|uniref:C3H1-type domain-containing protein n=1 Tax=Bodo saltans TaxID=75058 RepID=A0A0S4ISK2_BODSA|nr:Hypothetical protein, putative [Bodo saltans]|eukprot:CUF65222.1 Hypothetical protein, putative [Bodo saltans]